MLAVYMVEKLVSSKWAVAVCSLGVMQWLAGGCSYRHLLFTCR